MRNALVRRSSKVGIVLTFTLILGIVLGMVPAMADAVSTAQVNVHNVLAGQAGKGFSVVVTNGEPAGIAGLNAGKTINEVRIRGPVDLIDAVVANSTGPAAFSEISLIGTPPAEIRFRVPANAAAGTGIAPGGTATFNVIGDVRGTPIRDRNDVWRVRVSSNRGVNHQASTATGEGLLTHVRVLQVQNVAVLSPAGAADDRDGDGRPEVTGTQGNICVRTTVANAGAAALEVSPSLAGGNMTVGPARPAATPPCSAAPLANGSASIAADATRDFDFVLTAGNVGSATVSELTGTASAPGASTPASNDPDDDVLTAVQQVVIEPKSALTYVPGSLAPRAVVPDVDLDLEEAFSIRMNKGPSGSPPISGLNGQFESTFCDTQPSVAGVQFPRAGSPATLPGGTAVNQTVTFEPCDILRLADGRYQPSAKFGYTDANGLVQGLTPLTPDLEQVRLDSLIPSVDIDIIRPTPQVQAVPPVEPALTNGQSFTATGSSTDTDPSTGQQVACGPAPAGSTAPLPCTLEVAQIIQYPLTAAQGGGTALARRIDIKQNCSLGSNGSISCSVTPAGATAFDTGVQSAQIYVEVSDETKNRSRDGFGTLIDVDLIDPFIQKAETQRGGTIKIGEQTLPGQRRTIVVTFNEPVQPTGNTPGSPSDWLISDGSTKTVCNVSQSADKRTVTLTTCQELHADTTGVITYDPKAPLSSPYHDRVGKNVASPVEKTLADGIAPLAPSFSTVNGRGLQDDSPSTPKYFFNSTNPQVHMIQQAPASAEDPAIASLYIVEVYEDTDGVSGLNRLTDRQICGEVAQGDSITLTDCDFSGVDRTAKVFALSIDLNGNDGDASATDFVLDRVRPKIADVTVDGTEIAVDFDERVPHGDNITGDWTYIATIIAESQRTSPDVEGVADGATTAQRLITYSDQHHTPAQLDPDELRYHWSDSGGRYLDRAGNDLLDIIFVI
jgi:hypothetical protein